MSKKKNFKIKITHYGVPADSITMNNGDYAVCERLHKNEFQWNIYRYYNAEEYDLAKVADTLDKALEWICYDKFSN